MTTPQAPAPPAEVTSVDLNPANVTERVNKDLYLIKTSEFVRASDEYMSGRPNDPRPLQWHWLLQGLSFRFSTQEDPNAPPELHQSVNVTDKNGTPATWGTKDPEPSEKDSLPVQISKHLAKLGVIVENDPHVLDGMAFWCERKEVQAGPQKKTLLIPVEVGPTTYTGEVRIIQVSSEKGPAGNPATGARQNAAPTVSVADAVKALAKALDGKDISDDQVVIAAAMADDTVKQCPDLLGDIALGKAKEHLKGAGTIGDDGVFNAGVVS